MYRRSRIEEFRIENDRFSERKKLALCCEFNRDFAEREVLIRQLLGRIEA